jgi:hypothetical protein
MEQSDRMDVDPQLRSPSPSLPAPPVPDAPGPRAQALINAFDKALENTLARCNYTNFAACFPTPATYRSETLDMFWREFVGKLESFCKVSPLSRLLLASLPPWVGSINMMTGLTSHVAKL